MTAAALEQYLHEQIPASGLLAVSVLSCSDTEVVLRAPLEPNINHKNTAFGGSLSVLAILAGWSLVYLRMAGVKNEIVIQESRVHYLKAATKDFKAVATYKVSPEWERFGRIFFSKGKGRITVSSTLMCGDDVVATFEGTYVVFRQD